MSEGRCVYPGCGRRFEYDPANLKESSFPFCSVRCKGADLGNWVNEEYRVPSQPDVRDPDAESPEEFAFPAEEDDEESAA